MELNFLGYGSAFNSKLGNNSAFIKAESSLFLIDCGSTVFSQLTKVNENNECLLDDVTEVAIIITHLHADHCGSLGTLLQYLYNSKNIVATLIYPDDVAIHNMLYAQGVTRSCYYLPEVKSNEGFAIIHKNLKVYLTPVVVTHCNAFSAFAYILEFNDKRIFYSGDLKELPYQIQKMIDQHSFDEVYLDCSGRGLNPDEYWPHYQYENIYLDIPLEYRSNVYLMHIDSEMENLIDVALNDGFNFVFDNTQIIEDMDSIVSTATIRVPIKQDSDTDSTVTVQITNHNDIEVDSESTIQTEQNENSLEGTVTIGGVGNNDI